MSINQLPKSVLLWIDERRADSCIVARLCSASLHEIFKIEEWLDTLEPSANTLRELLRLVDEIAAGNGNSVLDIFNESKLRSIICEESLGKKEKQKRLRNELEAMRYPIRQRIIDRLSFLQDKITKESGVKVELPGDLEGDTITITFQARSSQQIESIAKRLEICAQGENLKELFAVLLGQVEDL